MFVLYGRTLVSRLVLSDESREREPHCDWCSFGPIPGLKPGLGAMTVLKDAGARSRDSSFRTRRAERPLQGRNGTRRGPRSVSRGLGVYPRVEARARKLGTLLAEGGA